jgi:hypothetical protein
MAREISVSVLPVGASPMRLRTALVLLVLATAIPLVAFALVASAMLVKHQQEAYVTAVKDRNRAFMSAVDAELKGTIAALQALGASGALKEGNLARFHATTQDVLATQPGWLNLILLTPNGQQVLNALAPWGTELNRAAREVPSVRKVVQTMRPAVGNVVYGDGVFTSRAGIAVRVPVLRDGKLAYILTAIVRPESFDPLIEQQHLPIGWVTGLMDGEGQFIARVPPRPIGSPASAEFIEAVRGAPEGWYRGKTVEGFDSFTAHVTSELSGWSVGFGVPSAEVLGGARRAAWLMGSGMLLSLALAVAIALWIGRRIADLPR